MVNKIPAMGDEVANVKNEMSGTVIACYTDPNTAPPTLYLDVRGVNERVYYGTPASNWNVVAPCDE